MATSKQKLAIKIALIGAAGIIIAAVVPLLKPTNSDPKTPQQNQVVNVFVPHDSNASSTAVTGKTKEPHVSDNNSSSYTKNKLQNYISKGNTYLDSIRENGDKIKKWEADCLAMLKSIDTLSVSEYEILRKAHNGNPPPKNVLETLILLMKIEENKLSN